MSECACLYGNADEPCDFVSETQPIARKAHRCGECGRTIEVGQRYRRNVGKFDGDFYSDNTCLICVEIQRALYCDGYVLGELWLDVQEQIFAEGGLTIACLDKLTTPAAKAYLQHRWMQFVEEGR